jgi:NADPH-dependent F420 reductase
MRIAIIGGTGNLGYGLALRFARAGHEVIIGSRTEERAVNAASEANQTLDGGVIRGAENGVAVSTADLVILSVPFSAQESTVLAIRAAARGKVVVDATVPLADGDPTRVEMPPEGSSAERVQALLPESNVVAAFHHIGAKALLKLDHAIETDVMICGDVQSAKQQVLPLMEALGTRGIDCGPLRQAQTLERITPMLIGLNIRHKRRHTGVRITGL